MLVIIIGFLCLAVSIITGATTLVEIEKAIADVDKGYTNAVVGIALTGSLFCIGLYLLTTVGGVVCNGY